MCMLLEQPVLVRCSTASLAQSSSLCICNVSDLLICLIVVYVFESASVACFQSLGKCSNGTIPASPIASVRGVRSLLCRSLMLHSLPLCRDVKV